MSPTAPPAYGGVENLEVMREAKNYNRFLLSLVTERLRPGDKVVDFGAGAGTFAAPLAEQGLDVICVEPDPMLAARLREQRLRNCTMIDEVADHSIDLIYTFNVLEHVADDQGTVRALARKLAPGGRLLVYVPAFAILFGAMDRKVGHLRRYRWKPLVALLRNAGLSVEEARYVDSLGFAAALLFRLLGDSSGTLNPTAVALYDRLLFPVSRAADLVLSRWLGKNLLVVARRATAP
jgi:SAM-dependent methyltransferase